MLKNYFKTAFRSLARNGIYSLINISGLSIGLACAMLIILYVKDEVSFDRFHQNSARIYRIVREFTKPDGSITGMDGYTGFTHGPGFKEQMPEIKEFVRFQHQYVDLKSGNDVLSQEIHYTDPDFFSVFSFPLLYGDPKSALGQPNAVVLSEDMAKKLFGTANAVGKTLLVKDNDQFKPYPVTAVTKNAPQNSSIQFQVLMPIKVSNEEAAHEIKWSYFSLHTFVLLAPDANVKAVESKMQRVYQADAKEAIRLQQEKNHDKTSTRYLLQPLTDMHLSKDFPVFDGLNDASNPVFSYILSGIAVFILLIACINFVNLTVARSIKRGKEIGVRKVIGGSRGQLMIQFLGESFIICLAAFILAVVIVVLALPVFSEMANKSLSLSYLLDVKLVAGYVSLFLLTAALAGFYPALVLSAFNPVQTLYNRISPGGKNYLQKSLVILQFSLASFLIIATFVVYGQFNFLTNGNLGYDDNNLVVASHWGVTPRQIKLLKQELAANPNIVGVTTKNMGAENESAIINGNNKMGFVRETIDEDFIPVFKISLAAGRNFSRVFSSDSAHSVLVNKTFARQAGWKNPIGQMVDFGPDSHEKYTVIGVVKDYHFEPLNATIRPQLFTLKGGRVLGNLYVRIKPKSETASLSRISNAFKQIFPESPLSYDFKKDENLANYQAEAHWKQIMLFGAIITLLISGIGLFGLSVLAVEARAKEIGVRKVLGASVGLVVSILSRDFLKLVIIALVLAVPCGWLAANKWLQNYPYRITLNWWMFAAAALSVIVIAFITVSFQTLKAALANPVKSLRAE